MTNLARMAHDTRLGTAQVLSRIPFVGCADTALLCGLQPICCWECMGHSPLLPTHLGTWEDPFSCKQPPQVRLSGPIPQVACAQERETAFIALDFANLKIYELPMNSETRYWLNCWETSASGPNGQGFTHARIV